MRQVHVRTVAANNLLLSRSGSIYNRNQNINASDTCRGNVTYTSPQANWHQLPTPWSNVLREKLIVIQVVKKFHTLYTSILISQKVPGMEVLHCNGMAYSNAYLITFKEGPLHAHAHTLAPSILPLLGAPAEGFLWNLPELGRRSPSDALHCCEA
jgi:hypothetical protein